VTGVQTCALPISKEGRISCSFSIACSARYSRQKEKPVLATIMLQIIAASTPSRCSKAARPTISKTNAGGWINSRISFSQIDSFLCFERIFCPYNERRVSASTLVNPIVDVSSASKTSGTRRLKTGVDTAESIPMKTHPALSSSLNNDKRTE